MPGEISIFPGTAEGPAKSRVVEETPTQPATDDGSDTTSTMSTMNLIDWDKDGDLDMVIGSTKGTVTVNINRGDAKSPKFGAREPVLGADGKALRVCQKSDPLPVDWDGDGIFDLLVGDEAGDVTFFRGRADRRFEAGVSLFSGKAQPEKRGYAQVKEALGSAAPTPGYRLRVETADWNADGKLDLLIGNCETVDSTTHGFVYVFLRQ